MTGKQNTAKMHTLVFYMITVVKINDTVLAYNCKVTDTFNICSNGLYKKMLFHNGAIQYIQVYIAI